MKKIIIFLGALFISGCMSGYQQFYKPYVDSATLTGVEMLKPGEEPQIYSTDNFERDVRALRAKMYIPIGYSSFNGKYEDEKSVKAQAKRVGAMVALVSSEYTNTQTTTAPLFLPSSTTTYSSGTVYGSGLYGGYSGSSTTYGTRVVPITTQQHRYNQSAVFFVKAADKPRYGVFVVDLTPEVRSKLQRNTGAYIDVVIEDTPAFYANLLPGDIILEVDGKLAKNAAHAIELMSTVDISVSSVVFKILRNDEEKLIEVDLKQT